MHGYEVSGRRTTRGPAQPAGAAEDVQVVLLNDDYTPMDFVITVLRRFFSLDTEQATRIMLKVHNEGRGVCGIFPRDIAATKVEQVLAFARQHQHPLACIMEEN